MRSALLVIATAGLALPAAAQSRSGAQSGQAAVVAPAAPPQVLRRAPPREAPHDTPGGTIVVDLEVTGPGTLQLGDQKCVGFGNGNGSDGAKVCKFAIPATPRIRLVATPEPGMNISHWSETCPEAGRQPICVLDPAAFPKGEHPSARISFEKGPLVRLTIKGANGTIHQWSKVGDYNFGNIQCWTDGAGVQKGTCEGFTTPEVPTELRWIPNDNSRLVGFSSNVTSCQGQSCTFVPKGPTDVTATFAPATKLEIAYYTQIPTKVEVTGNPTKTCYEHANTPWGPQIDCNYMLPPGQFVIINVNVRLKPDGPWQPMPQSFWQGSECMGQPAGACSLYMTKPHLIVLP